MSKNVKTKAGGVNHVVIGPLLPGGPLRADDHATITREMRIMRILSPFLCGLTLLLGVADGAEQEQVELSLRLTDLGRRQTPHLQILVQNVSSEGIEIECKGNSPAFYVDKWFLLTVDGKKARYMVNVASIFEAVATWRIPPGGVVLWAEIPLRGLSVRKNESSYDSAVKDDKRHVITISASDAWKNITVKSATLEIGRQDAKAEVGLGDIVDYRVVRHITHDK